MGWELTQIYITGEEEVLAIWEGLKATISKSFVFKGKAQFFFSLDL